MPKRVKDFRPATRNANRHTARGLSELEKSLRRDGWIGAMTTAADGEMIAGSARIEKAADVFGVDAEPIVVETDGTRPVVIVRKDIPSAADPRAQRLGLADNRIASLDLAFDIEIIAGFSADVIGDLWTPAELTDLAQTLTDDGAPPDAQFKEYDESVADEVEYCTCPACGHQWPK